MASPNWNPFELVDKSCIAAMQRTVDRKLSSIGSNLLIEVTSVWNEKEGGDYTNVVVQADCTHSQGSSRLSAYSQVANVDLETARNPAHLIDIAMKDCAGRLVDEACMSGTGFTYDELRNRHFAKRKILEMIPPLPVITDESMAEDEVVLASGADSVKLGNIGKVREPTDFQVAVKKRKKDSFWG